MIGKSLSLSPATDTDVIHSTYSYFQHAGRENRKCVSSVTSNERKRDISLFLRRGEGLSPCRQVIPGGFGHLENYGRGERQV